MIPLNKELRDALQKLRDERQTSPHVITSERSERTSASAIVNLFASWYSAAGLQAAQATLAVALSSPMPPARSQQLAARLRDVQMLAGHSALSTTQRYIEADAEAQKRVVDLI